MHKKLNVDAETFAAARRILSVTFTDFSANDSPELDCETDFRDLGGPDEEDMFFAQFDDVFEANEMIDRFERLAEL